VICCTVSIPQNLQDGSPLYRPIVCRCPLTGACPVRVVTAIFRCLPNLSRSSVHFLHGLFAMFTILYYFPSAGMLIHCPALNCLSCLTVIPKAGSGRSSGLADACLGSLSANSFPGKPQCPGTQMRVTSLRVASTVRASWHSSTSLEITFGPLSALSAAWLSEKIRIRLYF
jgi:hypothetical protein